MQMYMASYKNNPALLLFLTILGAALLLIAFRAVGRNGFGSSAASISLIHKRFFHTVIVSDSTPYSRWQCRIMYYWYNKLKNHPDSEMGGFTRILLSKTPDHLMDEIPTFLADPISQNSAISEKPWGFLQWIKKRDIEENYIFVAQADQIIVKPLPNLASVELGAAFPFFSVPLRKYRELLRKYFPKERGPLSKINPISFSPLIIQKSQFLKIVPKWYNLSTEMEANPDVDEEAQWVLQMYGFSIASTVLNVRFNLQKKLVVQPPWDREMDDKYILQYTYGCDYTEKGVLTYGQHGDWRFSKKDYTVNSLPTNLPLPPVGVPETVITLIRMINEATSHIKHWE